MNQKPTPEWKNYSQQACSGEAFQFFCDLFRTAIDGQKIRRVKLIGRRCSPRIFNTFLGYEIIAASKRIICPDMTTAEYLKIFAEIGMKEVAIPYNIVRTGEYLQQLQKAFASLKLILDFFSDQLLGKADKSRFHRSVYYRLRKSLNDISNSHGESPITEEMSPGRFGTR